MLPVAKHPFVILPALLVLVQYPERDTDIGGDKQFPRKNDNGFHLIILNQFFANLYGVTVAQRTVRQQETRNAVCGLQMRKHMQNPLDVARAGGKAAGDARKAIETQTGVPVITSKNAAQLSEVVTNLLEDAGNKENGAV